MINYSALEKLGWDFMPYGPEEWQWMKFDKNGKRVAIYEDKIWKNDCKQLPRKE